ncbi:MAG TPA: GNAT family N-acetyltransferase [Alphaproteobacteria bacterium]
MRPMTADDVSSYQQIMRDNGCADVGDVFERKARADLIEKIIGYRLEDTIWFAGFLKDDPESLGLEMLFSPTHIEHEWHVRFINTLSSRRGRNLMPEALNEIIPVIASLTGAKAFSAYVRAANKSSVRVMEKTGFKSQGLLPNQCEYLNFIRPA